MKGKISTIWYTCSLLALVAGGCSSNTLRAKQLALAALSPELHEEYGQGPTLTRSPSVSTVSPLAALSRPRGPLRPKRNRPPKGATPTRSPSVSTVSPLAALSRPRGLLRPKRIRPSERAAVIQTGLASWYGSKFHGRLTANGERYNQYALTAAHKTLPFGSRVRVTNLNTGQSIEVRINDRGPYIRGRVIDLSYTAARRVGVYKLGIARVQIEVLSEDATTAQSTYR